MGAYRESTCVQFSKSPASCSIVECHHLPNLPATTALFQILNHMYNKANPRPGAFVMFSDVVSNGVSRGENLAHLITSLLIESKLGGVLFGTEPTINPKTGNTVVVWLWTVDHGQTRLFYQDELANRVDVG